jgi:hypothetical protein
LGFRLIIRRSTNIMRGRGRAVESEADSVYQLGILPVSSPVFGHPAIPFEWAHGIFEDASSLRSNCYLFNRNRYAI